MKYPTLLIPLLLLLLAGAGCNTTPQEKVSVGNDAMSEHCKMMPQMAGCEVYKNNPVAPLANVSRRIDSLNEAKKQTEAALQNGASYSVNASFVKNTVNGKTIRMLAYNGQIPGPILRVHQGGNIKINFTNNLDEPTTIHWHGLRLDNANDGVPDMTQPPVNPGGTFTYSLKFPDAGLYWYHPHIREDYQQELGM